MNKKTILLAGTATLLCGDLVSTGVTIANAAEMVSETKASTKALTADQVEEAYKNGTDTGASELGASIQKVSTVKNDTVRGVDLTPYQAQLEAGVKYKDFSGKTLDQKGLMSFLKEQGVNYVSLKVAVDPENNGKTYGGGGTNTCERH